VPVPDLADETLPRNGFLSRDPVVSIKPILFSFRVNGIYEEYVAEVRRHLHELGRESAVLSFPSTHTPTQIRKELGANAEKFRESAVFADETVKSLLPFGESPIGMYRHTLDYLFSTACFAIVCEALGIKSAFEVDVTDTKKPYLRAYMEAHRARFIVVMKRAFRSELPDFIILNSQQLEEHVPFHILKRERAEKDAGRHVRRWLVDAGFPEDRIALISGLGGLKPDFLAHARNVWIIGDRHWIDKEPGKKEIKQFMRRVERFQVARTLDRLFRERAPSQEQKPERYMEEGMEHRQWDGDDGLEDYRRFEDLEYPHAGNGVDLTESEGDLTARIDRLEDALDRMKRDAELNSTFRFSCFALPMDSLLESLIAQRVLPPEQFRKRHRLVSLSVESINRQLPDLDLALSKGVLESKPEAN
jgi:hypothetical protein